MFEYNDGMLLAARIVANVLFALNSIIALVGGIVLSALSSAIFLLYGLIYILGSWVIWIIARLILSFICDVKLIRNKLYDQTNNNLAVFTGNNSQADENRHVPHELTSDDIRQKQDKLDTLLYSGVINETEYKNEINKIYN